MAKGFTRKLKTVLREHGCEFVRHGKGDHEVWRSPHAPRPFVVDGTILSRHTANAIRRQAGIEAKIK